MIEYICKEDLIRILNDKKIPFNAEINYLLLNDVTTITDYEICKDFIDKVDSKFRESYIEYKACIQVMLTEYKYYK